MSSYVSVASNWGLLAHVFFLAEGFYGETFLFYGIIVSIGGYFGGVASPSPFFSPSSLLRTNTRSEDIITTNTEYTIDPKSNIEETTLYYIKTLEVGKHHTMDPIMEGILSCSLASSRGQPPNELQLQIQYFSSCPITLLKPLYIVLPSPKNILEEESSRSRTF
jgi:hypothetical protein